MAVSETAPKYTIRVLHIDDDLSILEISKEILMMENDLEVTSLESVEDALSELSKKVFDVIVSDYEMPSKNGLQLLQELRKNNVEIPFILFTGKGREEVVIKALNLGVNGYVNKQGDPQAVYVELIYNIRNSVYKYKAEEALRESEEKYSAIINQASDGIFIIRERLLEYANPSLANMLGYTLSEAKNQPFINFFPPESRGEIIQRVKDRFAGKGLEKPYETKLLCKDGTTIDVELSGKLVQYGGKPADIGIIRNITERKKAQELLRQSEEHYRELINGMIDTVWVIGPNGDFFDVNDSACKVLGYSREELLSIGIAGIDKNLSRDQVQHLIDRLPRAGLNFFETVHTTKEGKDIPVEITSSLIRYQGKQAILSIARDITERKKIEEFVRQSEHRWITTLSSIGDAVIATDTEGKITFMNKIAEQLIGWNHLDALSLPIEYVFKIINEKTREPVENPIFRILKEGKIIGLANHTVLINKNGYEIPIDDSGAPIKDENGVTLGAVLVFRDVTERKESEARYQILFDQAGDYIIVLEIQPVGVPIIYDANQYALDVHGYSRDELIGKPITFLDVTSNEVDILNRVKLLLKNEKLIFEATHKRKDGSLFVVEVINKHIKIRDRNYLLSIERDITERKKIEESLNESRQKLEILNDKLKNAGSLTRHDIQNKLTSLNGYIYLIKKNIQNNPIVSKFLEEMEKTSQQIIKILEFESVYEQIGVETLDFLEAKKLFLVATSLVSDFGNVKLNIDVDGLMVFADSLLRQVLYNFIDNSLKYGMPLDELRLWFKEESDGISLIYEDNGVGISEEMRSYLFERGFGRGTGFGLFMAKKIVEGYGWTIDEKGESGEGVKFVIRIPKKNKKGQINYKFEDYRSC